MIVSNEIDNKASENFENLEQEGNHEEDVTYFSNNYTDTSMNANKEIHEGLGDKKLAELVYQTPNSLNLNENSEAVTTSLSQITAHPKKSSFDEEIHGMSHNAVIAQTDSDTGDLRNTAAEIHDIGANHSSAKNVDFETELKSSREQEPLIDQSQLNPLQSQLLSGSLGKEFTNPPPINPHKTTMSLILFLHLLFYLQRKRRTVKSQIQFSYEKIIVKRRYHTAFWSFLSHVPTFYEDTIQEQSDGLSRERDDRGLNLHLTSLIPAPVTNSVLFCLYRMRMILMTVISRLPSRAHRILPMFQTMTALPQLTYISHILWQIRSLEEIMYRNGMNYAKLILVITLSCTILKLIILWKLQSELARNQSSRSLSPFSSEVNYDGFNMREFNQIFGSSTFAPITSSLLVIYVNLLPNVPIQLLPFVRFLQVSASGVGFLLCILLLGMSSSFEPSPSGRRKKLQFWNVWIGIVNGIIFTWGIDIGLIKASYWMNCGLGIVLFMCLLSLWADQRSPQNLRPNTGTLLGIRLKFPCIDYVGWDDDGVIQEIRENERIWRDGLRAVGDSNSGSPNPDNHDMDLDNAFNDAFVHSDRNSMLDEENNLSAEGELLGWDRVNQGNEDMRHIGLDPGNPLSGYRGSTYRRQIGRDALSTGPMDESRRNA